MKFSDMKNEDFLMIVDMMVENGGDKLIMTKEEYLKSEYYPVDDWHIMIYTPVNEKGEYQLGERIEID